MVAVVEGVVFDVVLDVGVVEVVVMVVVLVTGIVLSGAKVVIGSPCGQVAGMVVFVKLSP
jgi:hypothetical protein